MYLKAFILSTVLIETTSSMKISFKNKYSTYNFRCLFSHSSYTLCILSYIINLDISFKNKYIEFD
uniref:Uncharacterized protein n=1 Tax=Solanum lycopersicum TaxID=4081 RepID=A0A3Q7HB01_SOLLC